MQMKKKYQAGKYSCKRIIKLKLLSKFLIKVKYVLGNEFKKGASFGGDERGGVMNRSALTINFKNSGCSLAKPRYCHLIHICK